MHLLSCSAHALRHARRLWIGYGQNSSTAHSDLPHFTKRGDHRIFADTPLLRSNHPVYHISTYRCIFSLYGLCGGRTLYIYSCLAPQSDASTKTGRYRQFVSVDRTEVSPVNQYSRKQPGNQLISDLYTTRGEG